MCIEIAPIEPTDKISLLRGDKVPKIVVRDGETAVVIVPASKLSGIEALDQVVVIAQGQYRVIYVRELQEGLCANYLVIGRPLELAGYGLCFNLTNEVGAPQEQNV